MAAPTYTIIETDKGPRSCTFGRDHTRTYTRTFHVDTSDPSAGAQGVVRAVGVTMGDHYSIGVQGTDDWFEEDVGAKALTIKADQDSEDPCRWVVTIEYGPLDPRQVPENPLDQPPRADWGMAQFERSVDVDQTGEPVLNSASDPFDPPLLRDDSRPVLAVSVHRADYDETWAEEYRDAVNQQAFTVRIHGRDYTFPARTAKIASIKAHDEFHPNVPGDGLYWAIAMEIHINHDTWDKKVLDQGLRYVDSGNVLRNIMVDGEPATSPRLLDGNGSPLNPGDTPYFYNFRVYKEKDFSVFGLGA